jgi:NADH:ubiquinone oxidoreductase subunit E
MTRRIVYISAIFVLLGVSALTIDYAIARHRASADTRLVESLQERIRENASLAPKLDAEQKRIAGAVLARKARIHWISVVLIASFSAFIVSAKRLVPPPAAPAFPLPLIRIEGYAATRGKPVSTTLPPPLDLSVVDDIVHREGTSLEAVIPILQAIQAHYRYLPDEAMRRVCELTGIPPALLAGTSSFYTRFRRKPVGRHIVRVCHGTACHVAGAGQITEELRRDLQIPVGSDTDPSRTFTIEEVACLGCCSLAPVLMVDDHTAGKLTPATACDALDAIHPREPA